MLYIICSLYYNMCYFIIHLIERVPLAMCTPRPGSSGPSGKSSPGCKVILVSVSYYWLQNYYNFALDKAFWFVNQFQAISKTCMKKRLTNKKVLPRAKILAVLQWILTKLLCWRLYWKISDLAVNFKDNVHFINLHLNT